MVNVVAMEDAEILTMLFPIKMVLNSFCEFSFSFNTLSAFLLPSSANALILWTLTVVSAVSAEEKNAERITNRISDTARPMELESKSHHLLFFIIFVIFYPQQTGLSRKSVLFIACE
jgi:hypothetical protein